MIRRRGFYIGILWVVTSLALGQDLFAQESYGFRENKGQWNEQVRFRASIPGGYIYLRTGGFTYALMDQGDLTAIDNYFHGAAYESDSSGGNGMFVLGPRHHRGAASPGRGTPGAGGAGGAAPVLHGYSYRVNFLGSNPSADLEGDHPSAARYNYLTGSDSTHWGRNVRQFGGVTYRNIYPHINARVYAQTSGLKYDLVAFPGSDPGDIRLQYQGAAGLKLKDGHLHIQTTLGEVIEAAPYAYQVIGGERREIRCSYRLHGQVLSFRISSGYDRAYPLIIDPRLIFATFSGSTADNWGYTATYDQEGNFYMGGIVFGIGYPVTPGAFEVNFNGGSNVFNEGGFDMALSKFSPDGTKLIYATYLGGSGNEQPQSLIVNGSGNLIIAGRTTDGSSFPHTGTDGKGGGWDITLTELNANGTGLVGSLVIGGTGPDGVNIADKYDTGPTGGAYTYSLRRFYGDDARSEVNIAPGGDIVLVGSTQSADFPANGFQKSFGGGNQKTVQQDGIVLKATPGLSGVIWSSYLGGSGNDAAYVVNFAPGGDLYVAGGTESNDFPGPKTGVIQPVDSGRVDGFIAEIRADGSAIVRSTYLGTTQADQIYGIQTDKEGYVYVGGTTEGVWRVTPNAKYPGINVDGKQFLCKLKPDLSGYVYSTVFGSKNAQAYSLPNISPTAFLVDRCENVYMSGWGGDIEPQSPTMYPNASTNNMPAVNAINPRPPDGRDFYFFVLKKDAQGILFASTYGQNGGFTDHVDGGTSRFDPTGVIYEAICGNCGGGTVFPTGPPGVYSRQNGSQKPGSNQAGCNVIGLKIAFDLDGVRGGVATLDRRRVYCNDEDIAFIDTLYGRKALSWTWDAFAACDTSQVNASTWIAASHKVQDTSVAKPYEYHYRFGQAGCYIVRLIKYQPNDCIERDTSYVRVKVGDNPAILRMAVRKLRPCNSYRYAFDNYSMNAKNLPFSDTAFLWDFGDGTPPVLAGRDTVLLHQFPGQGTYTISLRLRDTASFCNAPLDTSIVLSISDQLKAVVQAPDTVCIPDTYLLGNASQGGTNFTWVITAPSGVTNTYYKGDLSQLPYVFDQAGAYKVQLIAQDTVCGTRDEAVDSVYAYPKPGAAFTYSPKDGTNQIITFTNGSVSNFKGVDDELTYFWDMGDGTTSTDKNPRHVFPRSGTYHVELVTYNKAGCSDTASADVTETIIPKMDVPNAFTPNGDGVNDYIAPAAFGVTKIDFRIYNRWGQLVFRSDDPQITYLGNKGWDGTYKGKPQQMDVYAYTLHVVFEDGKQATKQGSIALIR